MMAQCNNERCRSVDPRGRQDGVRPQGRRHFDYGFTMVELLVVIGIITILAGLLIPAISGVRKAGMRTKSAGIISNLSSAIHRYHQEFGAYPGPVANQNVYGVPGVASTLPTMAENLVLSLAGGLEVTSAVAATPAVIQFNPTFVGTGPRNLNPAAGKINRQYPPYVEGVPLSSGSFSDEAGTANDTVIPEFLDGYPAGLPVLYLRANHGARSQLALNLQTDANNSICTDPNAVGWAVGTMGQYDLSQVLPYTATSIGVGKDTVPGKYKNPSIPPFPPSASDPDNVFPKHGLRTVTVGAKLADKYPYDAYAMLGNPAFLNTTVTPSRFTESRQRDGFILIGAGPDRTYGTEDDICSFGSISQ